MPFWDLWGISVTFRGPFLWVFQKNIWGQFGAFQGSIFEVFWGFSETLEKPALRECFGSLQVAMVTFLSDIWGHLETFWDIAAAF